MRRHNKQTKLGYPLTESQVTTAAAPLLSERNQEGGNAERKKEKKKSLLDPEIIAQAKTNGECGSSGGPIVVYSLFPQGMTRGGTAPQQEDGAALWNDLAQSLCKQLESG